jgi:5,10-methylenetetrahydromethanopterin reductase
MNEADQAAWNAGGHVSVTETTLSGPAQKTTDYVRAQIARGVTEIMLQPTGPDLRHEMATFADAARAAN